MPVKVLYIEDDQEQVDLVTGILQRRFEDVEVQSTGDGLEGIRKACEWKPDLILVDLVIPGADGIEVISQLRRDEAIGKITANEQNKLTDEQLAAMPLATLQAIADSLPAKPVANYSGAAGTAQAMHNEEKFAPFGLPSEYIPVEN